MKARKLLLALMGIALLAPLTSCRKEYVTIHDGSKLYTHQYTVKKDQWTLETTNDGRTYLFSKWENSDITASVMADGAVTAYVWNVYDSRSGAGSWNPLPYVYPYIYGYTEEGAPTAIAENIRFEYEEGQVIFVIEDMDAFQPDAMIDDITFKVCVHTN